MATFAFKALDLAGSPSKGEIEASDKQTVASQLRSQGLIVVDIEEKAAANAGDLLARFKKVKADDLVIASRQLATLVRVATQLEKDAALRRQIKAAMVYPSLIGGFALIVLVALVAFLVPVFEKIFDDFGGELPAITKFTVWLSHMFTQRWYVMIAVIVGVIWTFRRWKKTERGRVQWDRFKLKIPMKIGGIVQKVALARFSRTFSGLIAAGVPMLEAIDITGRTSGNRVVEKAMEDVRDSVKRGGTLTQPMTEVPEAFPVMVTQMIGVGEETGALETMLTKVADFYEEQVEAAVKALTSILEPIMIVVVGAIVGFIVIAMYLPMFKVSTRSSSI